MGTDLSLLVDMVSTKITNVTTRDVKTVQEAATLMGGTATTLIGGISIDGKTPVMITFWSTMLITKVELNMGMKLKGMITCIMINSMVNFS